MMKKTIGALLGITLAAASSQGASLYWKTDGSTGTITSSNWGTSASGPFTTAYTGTSDINFTATSTMTFVTNTVVGNITVTNGSTVNWGAAGTLSLGAAVRTFDVGTGSILDLGSQSVSTTAGNGIIKNGGGILFMSNGNSYTGGFTLNAGAIIVGGVNAMGNGGTLTVNGGTIMANGTRNITARYTSFTIGGDFTIGGTSTGVTTGNGSATANITFGDNANLGAANRKITIGASGTYTLTGVVSGSAGTGLTVDAVSGVTGKLVLTNVNTYSGSTTINAGTLVLSGTGTAGTGNMKLNGGKLDLSAYTGNSNNYALGSSQSLLGSGTVTGAAGKTISVAGNLSAGSGGAGTITLDTIALTLSGTSTFDFTNTSLALGTYDLVNGTAGADSVTFGGSLVLNFSGGTYADGTVKIFDLDSYAGSFSSLSFSGLSAGQSATFDSTTGVVTLTTVPEPATNAMLLGGVGALFWIIRRKRSIKA